MQIDINYRPSNTVAKITLQRGEQITTEAGAMVAMSPTLDIKTTTYKRGLRDIGKALLRGLAGESFFLNHYSARDEGEIWLSSALQGDLCHLQLGGQKIVVQSGSFLACSKNIEIKTGWQGFKSLFSGENLFWLELIGEGQVIMSSFGAIYEVDVDGDYIVDTGHIVAFEETLNFKISKAGSSWMHSFLGGEGLTCHFKGQGKVWCQSHNPRDYGMTLRPHLKVKNK